MPVIGEKELIGVMRTATRAILIEPPYRRKYLPLGLAKISGWLHAHGKTVEFRRNGGGEGDTIFISTLFTYDSWKTLWTLKEAKRLHPHAPVVIGGIYASLMSNHILEKFPDVLLFKGYSPELDGTAPDYWTDWGEEEPWWDFSYVFTTRGCPNRCAYCAVWRLESERWRNENWLKGICKTRHNLMVSDNNLSAWPVARVREIVEEARGRELRLCFDNGFDCKHVTEEFAQVLARGKYVRNGVRLSFDRIEEDGVFQTAIKVIQGAGVSKGDMMAFGLFNFKDKPRDADYRLRECTNLGIRAYPQQYTPLNATDRVKPYVGEHWTLPLVKAFRKFWLFAGTYTKTTFDVWRKGEPLSKEDHAKWEAGGGA
jgi:hypothetical protein